MSTLAALKSKVGEAQGMMGRVKVALEEMKQELEEVANEMKQKLMSAPSVVVALAKAREDLEKVELGTEIDALQMHIASLLEAWRFAAEEVTRVTEDAAANMAANNLLATANSTLMLVKLSHGMLKELQLLLKRLKSMSKKAKGSNKKFFLSARTKLEDMVLTPLKARAAKKLIQKLQSLKKSELQQDQSGAESPSDAESLSALNVVLGDIAAECFSTFVDATGPDDFLLDILEGVCSASGTLGAIPLVGPAIGVVVGIIKVYVKTLQSDMAATCLATRVLWTGSVLVKMQDQQCARPKVEQLKNTLTEAKVAVEKWGEKSRRKKFVSRAFGHDVFDKLNVKITEQLTDLTAEFSAEHAKEFRNAAAEVQRVQEQQCEEVIQLKAQFEQLAQKTPSAVSDADLELLADRLGAETDADREALQALRQEVGEYKLEQLQMKDKLEHLQTTVEKIVGADKTTAVAGEGLSTDQVQRAKDMLAYAYYGAGFCAFRLRDYKQAQGFFETAIGAVPTASIQKELPQASKEQQYEEAKAALIQATSKKVPYDKRRALFTDVLGTFGGIVGVSTTLAGLSDSTSNQARKFSAYCSYAMGKLAMKDGEIDNAQGYFRCVLDVQHRRWLAAWNSEKKDYVAATKAHLEACAAAKNMEMQELDKATDVIAWAEVKQLVQRPLSLNELVVNSEHIESLKQMGYTEIVLIAESEVEDLASLPVSTAKLLKKKAERELTRVSVFQRVQDVLGQLGVQTLGDLVAAGNETKQSVRRAFEEHCQRGRLYDTAFKAVRAALSPDNCTDTLMTASLGATLSINQTQSTRTHSYTHGLFHSSTHTLYSVHGNPRAQAKYDRDSTEMEPGSVEEGSFHEKARGHIARMATCSKDQVGITDTYPGSVILPIEFSDGIKCSGEQAAVAYVKSVVALADSNSWNADEAHAAATANGTLGRSEIEGGELGFMAQDTKRMLAETGVLDEFAPPIAQKMKGERVIIWQSGADDQVYVTIEGTAGQGAQGTVYRTKADIGEDLQALKCGRFSSSVNEALVFLKLNYPRQHPNLLKVDFVFSPDDSRELLCLMELVESSPGKTLDLEQAIETGVLYEGGDKMVRARLLWLSIQLALALEYMHTQCGVLHGDVKPANILIGENWRLVLMDFGISTIVKPNDDGILTAVELKGCSPAFCSGEVYSNFMRAKQTKEKQHCTHHADVFCFGATVSWRCI
jgi:tetratricopeptide (TPR) repeat protein